MKKMLWGSHGCWLLKRGGKRWTLGPGPIHCHGLRVWWGEGGPCSRSHGGLNSFRQCIVSTGCRHHPVASLSWWERGAVDRAQCWITYRGRTCFREALPSSPGDLSFYSWSLLEYLKLNEETPGEENGVKAEEWSKIRFTWTVMKLDKKLKRKQKGCQEIIRD